MQRHLAAEMWTKMVETVGTNSVFVLVCLFNNVRLPMWLFYKFMRCEDN
jgi:hypothetical protein